MTSEVIIVTLVYYLLITFCVGFSILLCLSRFLTKSNPYQSSVVCTVEDVHWHIHLFLLFSPLVSCLGCFFLSSVDINSGQICVPLFYYIHQLYSFLTLLRHLHLFAFVSVNCHLFYCVFTLLGPLSFFLMLVCWCGKYSWLSSTINSGFSVRWL